MISISQKLKLILKITKLSQEKLALKLGVSFVTLNSWINNKSIPRKKYQDKIDDLYFSYTGEKIIPKNHLQAQKNIIYKKSKKYSNILQHIINYPDLYDQLVLSLTYNTNSIEGSTLTENETAEIIFQGKSLANKSFLEHLEAKNHQTALIYLFKYLQNKNNEINEDLILKLHSILMNGIRDDAGFYRNHGVRIVGSNIPTANYLKIPILMPQLMQKVLLPQDDVIYNVTIIHSEFEKIHPFSDGNGRIGRLLIQAMLLLKNLPPALIKQENKHLYYSFLNKAQSSNDTSLLENFICEAMFEGLELLKI